MVCARAYACNGRLLRGKMKTLDYKDLAVTALETENRDLKKRLSEVTDIMVSLANLCDEYKLRWILAELKK